MKTGFSSIRAEIKNIKEELSDIKIRLDGVKHFASSNDSAIVEVVLGLERKVNLLEKKVDKLTKC